MENNIVCSKKCFCKIVIVTVQRMCHSASVQVFPHLSITSTVLNDIICFHFSVNEIHHE